MHRGRCLEKVPLFVLHETRLSYDTLDGSSQEFL